VAIEFRRGDVAQARGHALIYFEGSGGETWATYVVILPITVDVSKYVPPFLMGQMGDIGAQDLSAFAFPPAPEQVDSYEALQRMADARGDDILFAGSYNGTDVADAMMRVNDVVQQYADAYAAIVGVTAAKDTSADALETGDGNEDLGVNDVLYDFMSDGEKLAELSKLVGQYRFAIDGSDTTLVRETESEIAMLSRHLPDAHDISKLVETLRSNTANAAALAESYLQRSYHLVQEEYGKLAEIEQRISDLEAAGDQAS